MSGKLKSSIGLRLFIIAGLSILLLIPAFMIESLIFEREQRRNEVVKEINEKWGISQVIAGPVLTVPFKRTYQDGDKINTTYNYLHILPNNLVINGILNPELRYRGIYKSVLYNANLKLDGKIKLPDFEEMKIKESDILWDDAFLSINISDMKGIKEVIKVKWDEEVLVENPGLESTDVFISGVSTKAKINPEKNVYNFTFNLDINGSDELKFLPIGMETIVDLSSDWSNPSFVGNYLPKDRSISDNGFTSRWKVLNLNRNFPQVWIGNKYDIFKSEFGVKLLLPIDEYQKTMRTSKYAIMFIGLTFLAFFVIEVLNKKILHPVQYLLIGFAIILFYTLLLSFSEYISFNISYWIAAAAIAGLISMYTNSILSSYKLTLIIAGILLCLYAFLYIILQLQDYALLLGSIGLFIVLGIVMYITRKIDWYGIGGIEKSNNPAAK